MNTKVPYNNTGKTPAPMPRVLELPVLAIQSLLRLLWMGIQRLLVALRYQVAARKPMMATTAGGTTSARKMKMPWLQIGIAVVAVYMFTQKDVHFSINMKSPFALGKKATEETPSFKEMSIASPLVVTTSAKSIPVSKSPLLDGLKEEDVQSYIRRFAKVAMAEQEKFGIPASIKLAQGILESKAGEADATKSGNNHFGIPLSARNYDTAWENWRAHSLVLYNHYPDLFRNGHNYKAWAKGLQKTGYSRIKQYDQALLQIIDRYGLNEMDKK